MTTVITVAQGYCGRGWAVVPVPHRAKAPTLKEWPHLRLGAADLPRHFNGQPQNVGVLLGEPSGGLVDIDLDWPEAATAAPFFLPETGSVFGRTGKPRSHRLYNPTPIPRYAKFEDPTIAEKKTRCIVELRTDGHQTVFPGSTHPSGEAISWEQDGEPARVDGNTLRSQVARLAACCLLARHWPQGARQDAALHLAGGLLRAGWEPDAVEHFIKAVAATAQDEEAAKRLETVAHTRRKLAAGEQAAGWPHLAALLGDPVVDRIRAWLGIHQEPNRAGDPGGDTEPWPARTPLPALPSAPTLPESMVPEPLLPWLGDVAARACFPLEFVAAPALVALSAVVGRSVGIRPNRFDDYLVVPNLWGGIIARPGMMKTYAVQEGSRPLTRLAAAAQQHHQEAKAEREAHAERLQAEIAAIKAEMVKVAKKDVGAFGTFGTLEAGLIQKKQELAAATVTERRYHTQDATVEKLGELLQENPRGLLVLRDELAGWLRTLDKPGREGDREFYLEGWNGTGGYTFDRIGRGSVHIEAVCLSVLGGIQPGKLQTYIREATEGGWGADGLLQRLQLLVWPDAPGPWQPPTHWPDRAGQARAFAIFERLDNAPALLGDAVEVDDDDREGQSIPYLRFAPDAQGLFDAWRTELEARLRSDQLADTPAFESHLSKYRSLMPALALLFHLVAVADGSPPGPVPLEAAQLAAAWCEFLEAHAMKVYAAELSPGADSARALATKLREGAVTDEQTVRDLYEHHWAGLNTPAAIRTALDVLTTAGWVRVEPRDTGGRPSEVVRLHPDLRGGTDE